LSEIDDRERKTQTRLIHLFTDQLGYTYLGNWEDRPNNSNVEEEYLRSFLPRQKYTKYQQDKPSKPCENVSTTSRKTSIPSIRPSIPISAMA